MRFTMEYPIRSHVDGGAWLRPENVKRFAQHVEKVGMSALAVTDHPAPSRKWLDGGGHETFDPYAALTFLAAVTTNLKLMTRLIVVPYRNPLVQARSMMTVDVLSSGRSIFALGVGYLRSEFLALGVNFEERNELFDEAVDVMKKVFVAESFEYNGKHFKSLSQCIVPTVVQTPHPPLWLGGNSKKTLERVAQWADGWSVLFGDAKVAQTSRTPAITCNADLRVTLVDLQARLERHGRTLADIDLDVSSEAANMTNGLSLQERLDRIAELKEMGATWIGVHVNTDSVQAACDDVQRFCEEVAAKV